MNASEIKAKYPGYAGWNDEAAIVADFNATGGAGKGGSSSGGGGGGGDYMDASTILQNSISAILTGIKKVTPYEQNNPFLFDEEFARTATTAQYSPYYSENFFKSALIE